MSLHVYVYVYVYVHVHTCTCTCILCTCLCMHVGLLASMNRMHNARIHTYIHTYIHTSINPTYIHTYIHTYVSTLLMSRRGTKGGLGASLTEILLSSAVASSSLVGPQEIAAELGNSPETMEYKVLLVASVCFFSQDNVITQRIGFVLGMDPSCLRRLHGN